MAKQKDFFAFRCPDIPDVFMEKLQQQVKLLTDSAGHYCANLSNLPA